MKILLVTPMPPQPQGSGAIPVVLHALLTGLAPRHQITLVTVVGPEPAEQEAIERLHAASHEVFAVRLMKSTAYRRWQRRLRLIGAWLGGRYPWRTIWFSEPDVQRILDRLLVERRFDLVVVEDNAMGFYHYRTETPIIFTEHEVRRARPVNWHVGPPEDWLRWAFAEADWQRWPKYLPPVWRRFDCVQVFSARDAAAIGALAPDVSARVRVNPFGINLPAVADSNREEKGTILFVGNFAHPPNADAALWLGLEIMPRLRTRWPGVRLTIVGPFATKAVKALACADICVAGLVPEIAPYLERAAVVLASVRIGGGMRMKVLQAMASGKAVVTTPRGADGLAMNGQPPPLIIAENAEGIADAVVALLADESARRELGRRARAFVAEHFSPSAYAQRLEAIYEEIGNGKK
jgi:glycosyltransferase involved in cell wall biosynthesis